MLKKLCLTNLQGFEISYIAVVSCKSCLHARGWTFGQLIEYLVKLKKNNHMTNLSALFSISSLQHVNIRIEKYIYKQTMAVANSNKKKIMTIIFFCVCLC